LVDTSKDMSEANDVIIDGQKLGHIEGFSFYNNSSMHEDDDKALLAKLNFHLKEVISSRVSAFVSAAEPQLKIDTSLGLTQPRITFEGTPIAIFRKGERYLLPKIMLLENSLLHPGEKEVVLLRITNWLDNYITNTLPSLAGLEIELNGQTPKPLEGEKEPAPLMGMARGIAFRLLEHQGVLPRYLIEGDLRGVDQDQRKGLWRFRIRIGASTLFVPNLLKPAATELRLALWALDNDITTLPPVPTPGMVWCEMNTAAPKEFYRIAGFRKAGKKAIRVDMIERLADAVRNLGSKGKYFDVSPEIMGLVGLSGNDFVSVMALIGYKSHTKQIPAPVVTPQVVKEGEKAEPKDKIRTPVLAIPVVKTPAAKTGEKTKVEDTPKEKIEEKQVALDTIDTPTAEPEMIEKDFFKWIDNQSKRPVQQNRQKTERPKNDKPKTHDTTNKVKNFKPRKPVEVEIPDSNPFSALKSLKAAMIKEGKPKKAIKPNVKSTPIADNKKASIKGAPKVK